MDLDWKDIARSMDPLMVAMKTAVSIVEAIRLHLMTLAELKLLLTLTVLNIAGHMVTFTGFQKDVLTVRRMKELES